MTKTGAALIGLVLLCGTSALCAESENLLKNASFEDDKQRWGFLEPGDIVADSAHANAGSKAVRVTYDRKFADGRGFFRIAQSVRDLEAGEELTLSIWIKTRDLVGKATVVAKFWIDRKADKFEAYFVPRSVSGTTPWQEYVDKVVVPEGFNGHLQVVLLVFGNAKSGEAYFDDLCLTRGDVSEHLRKRLDAIQAIADKVEKWEALTAFAAGKLLLKADPSLTKEARDGIALLLKDPAVQKEHNASAWMNHVLEMEQKARRWRSENRKKHELAVVAASYRNVSRRFKSTRAGERCAAAFERLCEELGVRAPAR